MLFKLLSLAQSYSLERGYSRSDLLPYIIQTKGRHIFLGLLWFVQSFVSTSPLHSRWVVSFGIHCLHHSGTLAIILCRWSNMLTLALHKDPSGAVSSLCELKNPADSYLV
ncbi:hypothetical protein RchiOBHm_Chr6g0263771 [Rosa chinensis]|uniref:Uncharacterized protein n=1 Tax=Rosa chinensis TaxID=74649 RepID=A0A2P6PP10_ROSCH|nr:hypothetical protein RchiOBHm_Chr6g0263771 [Rosa chinensis]